MYLIRFVHVHVYVYIPEVLIMLRFGQCDDRQKRVYQSYLRRTEYKDHLGSIHSFSRVLDLISKLTFSKDKLILLLIALQYNSRVS